MRTLKKAKGTVLAILLSVSMLLSGMVSASALSLEYGGVYVADYDSQEAVLAAADELNVRLSAEGSVLLKNDGTLPLFGNERLSVFGGKQRNLEGGSGTGLLQLLREAGFQVNPVLEGFYSQNGEIGVEPINLNRKQEQSLRLYNDLAIVVLSRTGAEGADPERVTGEIEDNLDGDGNDYGWRHEALGHKGAYVEGVGYVVEDAENLYKHYLELTDSEEAMLSYVKARFSKIVVILNTSNAMEMANLQEDDAINAILWIGRPGSTGLQALPKILNGEVNPSGKLVDEWNRDFTTDPTWQNFGTNDQVGGGYDYLYNMDIDGAPPQQYVLGKGSGNGLKGVDYDEGIYFGYKYFETVYAEIAEGSLGYDEATKTIVKEGGATGEEAAEAWWSYAVVYPFGYGLSYTTFTQTFDSLYYKDGRTKVELSGEVDGDDLFSSAAGSEAKVKELYADVTVTNTGSRDGKQVVQIYVTAPYYAGGIEKAHVSLVGYAKSSLLRPGQSEVVTVRFNVQDAASFDYNDANDNGFFGYELEAGEYTVKVMEDSHRVADEKTITLTTGATLGLDDFSGNEIDNIFSKGDMYDTLRVNHEPGNPDSVLNFNKSDDAGQVLLSRTDLSSAAVQDLYIKENEREMSDAYLKSIIFWNTFDADAYGVFGDDVDATAVTGAEHFTWYKTEDELKALMAGWTQADAHEDGYTDVTVKMKDMSGIDMTSEEGAAKWVAFMNQLTWDEIMNINNHGSHTTAAIPSIGKVASKDENGPNSFNGKSWCCSVVVASTWNVKLAEEYGITNGNLGMLGRTLTEGWYGPGMDLHRSPFGGRNNEYYSQDGIQGGYIAAALVAGALSRGLNVYIKHIFMNDQEAARCNQCIFTWAPEQAIREIYAKAFQMSMQEGGCTSAMTAYNRIGGIVPVMNDRLLNKLTREEWGWVGSYVTDYYSYGQIRSNHMDLLLRAGCDLPDGTASGVEAVSGKWNKDAVGVGTEDAPSGNVSIGGVVIAPEGFSPAKNYAVGDRVTVTVSGGFNGSDLMTYYEFTADHAAGPFKAEEARRLGNDELEKYEMIDSLAQWYYARISAQRVLHIASNTLNNRNGVASSTINTVIDLKQGVAARASIALPEETLNGNEVVYSVSSGTLPAGISLNPVTGAITGTPSGISRNRVVFTASIGGWIRTTINAEVNVASAFTLSDGDKDVDSFTGKVGTFFEGFIESDVVTSESFNAGITYSVAEGALPKGLKFTDNIIEGTPEEAGTFELVINVTGARTVQTTGAPRTNRTTYLFPLTITIEGEGGGETPAEGSIQIRVEEGVLQFTTDGENWINIIAVEALTEILK